MSYPTQEDELRAKEAYAKRKKENEESRFFATFQNVGGISDVVHKVVDTFDSVMDESRQQPFERQEELMVGMQKLLREKIRLIEARRIYAMKLNPETVAKFGENI